MDQKDIDRAREHYKQELRLLTDYFGEEKHPEKIELVLTVLELLEKEAPKEPTAISIADLVCPNCRSWIPFDRLNGKIESAPKRCPECGQKLSWEVYKHE